MLQKYKISKVLGDGTFGVVSLAQVKETGEMVAIKRMKQEYRSWDDCLKLKEVQALSRLKHTNIVKVKEIFRDDNKLYFVFEYMKENLYEMLKDRKSPYPETVVRNLTYQILQAVNYMHRHGYFHRDLKPENILCQGPELVKLADFGQAREIRSRPPYTDYVSTRWYRAPEVQLGSTNYNSPIDIWAIACIMSEIYTCRPLFPGTGTIDQIFKFCSILGTPTKNTWSEGVSLAMARNVRLPVMVPTSLHTLVPMASDEAINLMKDMLQWDPRKRPTATQVLSHRYFQVHVHQRHHSPVVTRGQPTNDNVMNHEMTTGRSMGNGTMVNRSMGNGTMVNRSMGNGTMANRSMENGMMVNRLMKNGVMVNSSMENGTMVDRLNGTMGNTKANRLMSNGITDHGNAEKLNEGKQWWMEDKRGSQDSGVDSEINNEHSNNLKETTPFVPPTKQMKDLSIRLPVIQQTSKVKRIMRRRDMFPDVDTHPTITTANEVGDRQSHWVAMETPKVPMVTKSEDKKTHLLPWQHPISKNLPAIDKTEAANYYLKRSRYSPSITTSNTKLPLGFGSSAPRFKEDSPKMYATPSPMGRHRPQEWVHGQGDMGRHWPQERVHGQGDVGNWSKENTGINERGRGHNSLLGYGGVLARTDWSNRYRKRY
jgi:serine/threonine protein kinase